MILRVHDLGRITYHDALDIQLKTLEEVSSGSEPDTLLLLEHDPVLTLGANFHEENLLYPATWYEEQGIQVTRTDRGGDITYHGPGQLVMYPIFDLKRHGQDLHRWLRDLEEIMLLVLRGVGIEGRRFPPHTGAWVEDRKVAAIGVKIKRWVSIHGIALNVDNDLSPFSTIIPCGIQNYGVTSLASLGISVTLDDLKPRVIEAFQDVFGFTQIQSSQE